MREVPYFTTDDDAELCGHIWRQRQRIGGPWGFAWEVMDGDNAIACGWDATQEAAERRMNEALETHKTKGK